MTFRILSLSGGGFMGFYTAVLLAELERKRGREIGGAFDLIAGTSIGGIIALGLAAGTSARDIAASFEGNGHRIFSTRRAPKGPHEIAFEALRHVRGAKYSAEPLRETIAQILGSRRMAELDCAALVPAVDITHGRPHIFKTPHLSRQAGSVLALDAAMATSAAPTIFPLHMIDGTLYADGGVFSQAPDMLALAEAVSALGIPMEEIEILSIGTTTSSFDFGPVRSQSLGLTDWIENQRAMRLSWAMQQQTTGLLATQLLGDRYLRIDTDQSLGDMSVIGLDIASSEARIRLRDMAMSEVNSRLSGECAGALGSILD